MKYVADLHVHTVASGHAFSTVLENAQAAKEQGLELIAITDHGPAMVGGPHQYHFSNMRILPDYIAGIRILRGVEANIVDHEGNLDLKDRYLNFLDIVLAGFHADCLKPGSQEENTRTLIKAIIGGRVDIIVHPGNPAFPIHAAQVAQAAVDNNVLLEINNASLSGIVRRGSEENCPAVAAAVAKLGGMVSLGSDAHYCASVGNLGEAVKLAKEVGLSSTQVVNCSWQAIDSFLVSRGRQPL